MKFSTVTILGLLTLSPTVFAQKIEPNKQVLVSESVEELVKIALTARSQGRFADALDALLKAEKIEPKNLDVQFYIGLTQYNLSDLTASERTLRAVLVAEPKHVDAKIILGRVLLALGKITESERLLREVISQAPDSIDAYDALASNLSSQQRFGEAVIILDNGLLRSPDDIQLLVKKGIILFYDKKINASRVVADKLISLASPVAKYEGKVLKAKIAFEKNPTKIAASEILLLDAINILPQEAEAHVVLADIYASHWKFKQAEDILNDALASVSDRDRIEVKIQQLSELDASVDRFQLSTTASSWNFDDKRAKWTEFYLDGVWRIDPYKTLVLGVENFSRDDISDQTLRIEYSQKIKKWVYVYAAGRMTVDPDFRERNGVKIGTSFVTNPLNLGSTVITTEAEGRFYDSGKVYFLSAGVEQYIGSTFILNAKLFRVLSAGADFNVWNTKLTWNVTDRLSLSGGYGTMTEDVSGRLASGHSYNLGGQYRVNNRFSVVGNYTRHSNVLYKADQYNVGVKINLGKKRK